MNYESWIMGVITKTRIKVQAVGIILVGAAVAAAFGYAAYQQIDTTKSGASRTAKEERAPAVVEASKLKRDLQSANAKIAALQQTWQRAKEKDRARVLKQLLDAAKKRKDLMAALMPVDPQGANTLALSPDFRAKLPTEAQQWIEEYKEIEGELDIFHADNFKQGQSYEQYFLRDDAKMIMSLFMAEPEFDALSSDRIFATGIFFSDIGLALKDKNPKVLAVSPPETLGEQRTIVALVQRPGKPGIETYPTAQEVYQEAIFGEHNATITPSPQFITEQPSLRRLIEELSYGKATITGSIAGWVSVSESDLEELSTIAQQVINGLDNQVNWSQVDRLILFYSLNPNEQSLDAWIDGNAYIGKRSFNSDDGQVRISVSTTTIDGRPTVLHHEFGHGLGLRHGSGLLCPPGIDWLDCSYRPMYGDKQDLMGKGILDFSTAHRERLGWLDPGWSATVADMGEYTLKAKDLNGTGIKQIKIPLGERGNYSVEYYDPTVREGILPAILENFGKNILIRFVPTKPVSQRDQYQPQYPHEGYEYNTITVGNEFTIDIRKPFHDVFRNIHIGVNEALGTERQVVVLNNVIFPQFDLSALTVNSELTADGEIITQATISGPAYWIDLGNLHFQYLDQGSNVLAECRMAIGVFETPTVGDSVTIERTMTTPMPRCDLHNSKRAKVSTVRAWVDIDQLFPETNEFNNMAQAPIPKPDLVITDFQIALTPTDYVFAVTIQNNGSAPTANISGERAYQIELRKFKQDGTDSSLLSHDYTDAIMPGASTQVVITKPRADIETWLSNGVGIQAKVETPIESNIANNTFYKEMPKPDLQVSNLTVSQAQDGTWSQVAHVVNQGGMPIALPFEVEFRRILQNGSYVVDGIVPVTTLLETGAFADVPGPTLTVAQVDEASWLRAWADSGSVITESSENNNTKKIPAP